MKMLIEMGLPDRLLEHYIFSITLLEEISKILIVRDTTGPKINKVDYYCPPSWSLRFPILALFFKFLLMIYLSIREKPRLIHGYLLFPHGILAFLVGKLTRRRVGVSLVAGPRELYVVSGSSLGKYVYNKPLPKLSLEGKVIRAILKNFDVITVTGSYTKRILIENGIPKNRIIIVPRVTPNAFDERFTPMDTPKKIDVIYLGRLSQEKQVETLIKAISIVKKSNPDIKVAIVGDGPEKNKLEELSRKMNVTENIFFAGYQTDIWNWYNKAKVSVLTSEREGFPYSVVESLSCGVPVIASNCGDICDVIKDGYNGEIIDDYQAYESFATAILELLQNPHLLNEYSENALKTAEKLTEEKAVLVWKDILKYLYCDDQV